MYILMFLAVARKWANKSLLRVLCLVVMTPSASWAQEYQVKPVKEGGSITGVVSFAGAIPKPRQMAVTKDTDLTKDKVRQIDVVVVKDGKLAEAVVYLKKVRAGKDWPELKGGGMIDQKGVKFIVNSRVIHNGQKVLVKNSDPVLHNIHAYELIGERGRRTMFNKGQPKNIDLNLDFEVKGSPFVKIECDAHNFMHDYVFVANNPYYSVTAEDGKFNITDIPAGNYILMTWHPNLGTQKAKIKLGTGENRKHNFTFTSDGE